MPKKKNITRKEEDGEKPDPPPPAPAPLVKLLQKNSKVLKYFQSLQANLDYDVQKWKNRARKHQAESAEWKEKADRLQKQLESSSANGQLESSANGKKRAAAAQSIATRNEKEEQEGIEPETKRMKKMPVASTPVASTPVASTPVASTPVATTKPEIEENPKIAKTTKIGEDEDWLQLESSESDEEDNFFDEKQNEETTPPPPITRDPPLNILALSSDDDADEDEDDISTGWLESQFPETKTPAESANHKPHLEMRNNAIRYLSEAQQLLDRIGVPLVTEKVIQTTKKGHDVDNSEGLASAPEPEKVIFERRPDQAVIIDLLQVIRTLVRIRVNYNEDTHVVTMYPFMTEQLVPCYESTNFGGTNYPQHAAVEGFRLISDALCLMDAYCPMLCDTMSNEDHESQEKEEKLVRGMTNRHRMVQDLLQSLEGELFQLWPYQDRSNRLITTSVHFEPPPSGQEDESKVAQKSISFGSKNLTRLAALCERCFLARIVARLHQSRQDPMSAFQCFWKYLLATTPAVAAGPSPAKLPPVQSFCVMEALLDGVAPNPSSDFPAISSYQFKCMSRVIRLVSDATASIYMVRSGSDDERIADVARVELRAKSRLMANCRFWTEDQGAAVMDPGTNQNLDSISSAAVAYTEELLQLSIDEVDVHSESLPTFLPLLLELLFVLVGKNDYLDKHFQIAVSKYAQQTDWTLLHCHLLACVRAKKQLEIRHLTAYRQVLGSPSTIFSEGMRLWDYSAAIWKSFEAASSNDSSTIDFARIVLTACMELADGEVALQLAKLLMSQSKTTLEGASLANLLNTVETLGQLPTLKIINLERRPDRLAHFLAQAVHQGIMVMRAVADIVTDDSAEKKDHWFGGAHALDGGNGRPVEIELRLSKQIGCEDQEGLNGYVDTHWRPNDLKVFDTEAPNSLDLVRISSSEKACALSHIASWKGISRCLASTPPELSGDNGDSVFRDHDHLRRKFHIGGYARGPALFPENEGMGPSPVCIVLEDDAILVDRFVDRLESVLAELPRDFHFCSLGYSRPKTAPLIPYSTEIGMPSCIWYLTGYILSLEGASYLLNKLPVLGPVDSWIGLHMFRNWDNMFGHAMGVGMAAAAKPSSGGDSTSNGISRKDLRSLLRFRAFAATVPLCSQKVGVGSNNNHHNNNNSTGRNWRQRDTDIVYSGNSIK
eukprot:scaffold4690_cov116-Cylindrotheca_fusiformis.AAC.6